MHENRDTSGAPRSSQDRGRPEKALNHKSGMHASEESDRGIIPMSQPNNEDVSSAEVGEGRLADQGEHRSTPQEPDPERGTRVPRVERCATTSKRKEARTVHGFASPSHR